MLGELLAADGVILSDDSLRHAVTIYGDLNVKFVDVDNEHSAPCLYELCAREAEKLSLLVEVLCEHI